MRSLALLWTPLGRVQLGRLPRRPSISRASARSLLAGLALTGALALAAPACAGAGGQLASHSLALAREMASAAGDRLAAVPDGGCAPDSLLPPIPTLGDGADLSDFQLVGPDCDDR